MSRNPGQNSMTWAEVMIDGKSIGKWDNKGGDDHAEIKLLQHLRETYRPEDLKGRLVSIVINRAPCAPCARALATFKREYGVHMRVKATRITQDGEGGLPVLSAAGIHFRLYTRAQRDSIHTATAPNKRTWKVTKDKTVTEADRHKRVSGGRDTKTLEEQEEAEEMEASLAEKYFPNARSGWAAQGLSRAAILGGGSASPGRRFPTREDMLAEGFHPSEVKVWLALLKLKSSRGNIESGAEQLDQWANDAHSASLSGATKMDCEFWAFACELAANLTWWAENPHPERRRKLYGDKTLQQLFNELFQWVMTGQLPPGGSGGPMKDPVPASSARYSPYQKSHPPRSW